MRFSRLLPVLVSCALLLPALGAIETRAGGESGETSGAAAPALMNEIVYLGKSYKEPEPLSLVDPIVTDHGIQGARIGIDENNMTGRLIGQQHRLLEAIVPEADDITIKAKELLASGHRFIVADLEPADLLKLADLPEAADAVILDVRTVDDDTRQEQCRANVFHIRPSWAMKADALAQYLSWKKWRHWLLIVGKNPKDLGYAKAVRRAAARFGGQIVEERTYKFEPGSRRTDTGHQQIQTQMPLLTLDAPEHDVIVVADEEETFGEYVLFRTQSPRPVVGTHGLIATAWHRSFEEYAATQMQNRFERKAKRVMHERDYAGWIAVRILGEAVTRVASTAAADVRKYILSDKFEIAGFKGEGLTFRRWDLQLRQPILIAGPRALVSISPQEGFLHQRTPVDTLGYDRPETKCRKLDAKEASSTP
jgi:ABC transporter substrate binding protein (PQQ-dependent alcohol dehydrogenase system)